MNKVNQYDKKTAIPKQPGIYLLTCLANGKVYIGETLNLYARISEHRCAENHNDNEQVIHLAIKKHGWYNFHVYILVSFNAENVTKEELIDIEERYIAKYNSTDRSIGYNVLKRGTSRKGYKTSEETKKKLSLAGKGKKCGKDNPMFGKKVSQETRQKISISQKGRKHSPESIAKRRGKNNPFYNKTGKEHPCYGRKKTLEAKEKSAAFHRKAICQIDILSGKQIKLWSCAADAGRSLKNSPTARKNINRVLNNKAKSAYGFYWKYLTESQALNK